MSEQPKKTKEKKGETKPAEKEPWKPKEKFDKKANKEKKKLEQQQEQETQQLQQENNQKNETNDTQQKSIQKPQKIQEEQEENKKQIAKEKIEVHQKSEFTSHLKIYKTQSTSTIFRDGFKQIHPAIVNLAIKFQQHVYLGSTFRCLKFLEVLKEFIQDLNYTKKNQNWGFAFDNQFVKILEFFEFAGINEGMQTASRFIRQLMPYLFKSKIGQEEQKNWLCEQINQFINQKIINACELIQTNVQQKNLLYFSLKGSTLIEEGSKIMVYARSYLIENLLISQWKKGKKFEVFIVNNPPYNEGTLLLESLQKEGINCYFLYLSHVSYIINQIDKVFVGASSMLSNGALISRTGTALLAVHAYTQKIPFHVFCESYKFADRCQIDSLSTNELAQQPFAEGPYNQISLRYDITPAKCINLVVTEIGLIPATSVKIILREFAKYNYIDNIEIPMQKQNSVVSQ